MMKKTTLALALVIGLGLEVYAATYTFTASSDLLLNPERGLYRHAGPLEDGTNYDTIRAQGSTLCYSNIKLNAFRSSNISASYLQEIKDAFSRIRAAGLKCILRITYNDDISGIDTTLAWMEIHLQQLQPILEDNSDVIAFVQAGMIGAWGEWHTSSNGLDTPAGREAVYDLLVAYMPADKFIQIRTPGYVNELVGLDTDPIDDTTAFSGTPRARIAHHNDAWVSSFNDMGTYPNNSALRETLKDQIAHDTKYAPWGGESAALYTDYTQPTYVLAEAERFHATYLNATYNPDVIAELTANGSWDVIQKNLGHRIELTSAVLPDSLVAGSEFPFEIRLQNSGWAPFYNPRPVFLRILSGSVILQEIELATDPRFWRPESGEIVISNTAYAACSTAPEHLGFALWLPDPSPTLQSRSDYSVQCANDTVWDSDQGHNVLKHPLSEPTVTESLIVVDGDLSEWDSGDIFYETADIEQGSPNNSTYENVYLANDAEHLYIGLDTKGTGGGSINNTWTHTIYLDTDMNAGTGYSLGWMTYGYDRQVQYGAGGVLFNVSEFTGITQSDNSWSALDSILYAYNNDIAELAVPLSALGLSGGDSAKVELNVSGTGTTSDTWAYKWESGARTYTLDIVDSTPMTNQVFEYIPASGNMHMEWHGPSNSVIDVEASADLENWSLLGRGISNSNGELLYIDHPPASEQKRFYRAN